MLVLSAAVLVRVIESADRAAPSFALEKRETFRHPDGTILGRTESWRIR